MSSGTSLTNVMFCERASSQNHEQQDETRQIEATTIQGQSGRKFVDFISLSFSL